MQITIEHLTKRFGDTVAVNDLCVALESGKLTALLGPSGCGKSTVLNMISGILPVSAGRILFDGRDVTALPPEKRGVGLVFQNYALYPHMTALQNICFPMEIRHIPKKSVWSVPDSWRIWFISHLIWTVSRRSSPAASSSAWPLRVHWQKNPRCFCWTSH